MTKDNSKIRNWALAGETMHYELRHLHYEDKVMPSTLFKVSNEMEEVRRILNAQEFYKYCLIMNGDDSAKKVADLHPLGFFTGGIEVGLTERVNLLERESVQVYRRKIKEVEKENMYLQEVNNTNKYMIDYLSNREQIKQLKADLTLLMRNLKTLQRYSKREIRRKDN